MRAMPRSVSKVMLAAMILATADTVSNTKASRRTPSVSLAFRALQIGRVQVRHGDRAPARGAAQLDGARDGAGAACGYARGHEAALDRERARAAVAQTQRRPAEAVGDEGGDLDRSAGEPAQVHLRVPP